MSDHNLMSTYVKGLCFDAYQALTADGIIAVDRRGHILHINQKYADALGIRSKDALGKNARDIIPITEMLELMEKDTTDRNIVRFINTSKLTPTSKDNLVLLSRTPLKDSDGQIIGAIGYLRFYEQAKDEFYKMHNIYSQMSTSTDEAFQIATEKTHALLESNSCEVSMVELLSLQLKYFQEEVKKLQTKHYPVVIGSSPAFQSVKSQALRIAKTSFSVLITGESGTGKEVITNLIHASSDRSDKPLVTINCAAIPAELLESELFGYTKGAFTGANRDGKLGKIAAANGGSIFLDEIGDMPLPLQAKLLRVLENHEIEPIGSTTSQKVDIRFISATRKNLEQMVTEGTFREDLYFRINELRLHLPPLRERTEDIPLLVKHILSQINSKYDTQITITEYALSRMMAYRWPGNVRELNNVIKGAYCMAENGMIDVVNLPQHIIGTTQEHLVHQRQILPLREQMDFIERQLLIEALEQYGYNLKLTAKKLDLSRSALYKKLAKHRINPRSDLAEGS